MKILALLSLAALARALPQGLPGSINVVPSASVPLVSSTSASAPVTVPSAVPSTGPYTGGDLTFYSPATGQATACGQMHQDSDPIAALPEAFSDGYPGATPGNPNHSPLCGRQIAITAAGRSITATVADICGGCNISTSVDVSPVLFAQITDPSVGRVHNISWDWLS
ncbi:hypothetical protein FB451DRAFT_1133513 [Mycena latifolia]|nr:hypothetical protein FB451DRAFT_1133513 [Mycena latifolia]